MRRIITISALGAVCAALALAESWTGKLIDASCYDSKKEVTTCDATSATTMFAIDVSGKVYKLDDAGNAKAVAALKSRADRSSNPSGTSGAVTAKVSGTKGSDDTIKVESIDVR
ncbi:MAG TPA: hypothetical protein VMS37_36380 [Verrucomicrobiae bacterium]|nr:hypothetical protein [Verrucomicrobiae bacterium]